eukprot:CAMPEP_0201925302 /NCGR_PEP_ID=MMETSP0903-20130614/14455_1 /ASSEMBLY_ACC=CAM_ASM_000552 /TAXON_ID=420261 /ORGANISM="Thalassiosira antarctica, Strain CCMP982" /LENGTH=250 /DNA_ID=CAMNT_0048462955 /DNA_START=127 /DNA_END=879 /DNA_ORIENTATION=-
MKFTGVLVLLWASQLSMAAEHDETSPRPFHISKKFVGDAHLRGASDESLVATNKDSLVAIDEDSLLATDEDLLLATDEAVEDSLSLSDTPQQWLNAHNTRRKKYHVGAGVSYRPLKWSVGLKDLATNWAKDLAKSCKNKSAQGEEYGVNSQGQQGSKTAPSAGQSLQLWESKLGSGYPANQAMTQALWRPTNYVGCGSASSGTGNCAYSVCYYAKPGNCGMGKFTGNRWKTPTYADKSGCTPDCPPEGCK